MGQCMIGCTSSPTEELYAACAAGDASLAYSGSTVSSETNDGTTPLHFAAHYGFTEIVRLLLENGAYVDVRDRDGDTPLAVSAMQGHTGCMHFLLKSGAACRWDARAGPTPLHRAIRARRIAAVQTLLEFDPEVVRARDADGQTPLHVAAAVGDVPICTMLIDLGHEALQTEDLQGRTPLFHAAASGSRECFDLMLQKGSDWAHQDIDGRTPLAYLRHIEEVGASTRYSTAAHTLAELDLSRTKQPTQLAVDLVRRLETQKIMLSLSELEHASEALLLNTRVAEQQALHLQQIAGYEDEARRLREHVLTLKGKIKKLKETSTGKTISALASELATARTKLGTPR